MVKRMGFFCFCTCLCVLWIFAKAETWVVNTSRTRPEFCTWMAIAFLHYNHHPSRVQSFFLDMKLILLFSFFLLWSFSETLFKAVKKFVFFFSELEPLFLSSNFDYVSLIFTISVLHPLIVFCYVQKILPAFENLYGLILCCLGFD